MSRFVSGPIQPMRINGFWDMMPCRLVNVYRRLGGTHCLRLSLQRTESTLKRVAVFFTKTSIKIYQTKRCYVLEDSDLRICQHEYIRSHNVALLSIKLKRDL
jgi:hypothetical protein